MSKNFFNKYNEAARLLSEYGLEIENLGHYDNIIHEFELELFELKKTNKKSYDSSEIEAIKRARPLYREYLELAYDPRDERHNIRLEDKLKTTEREEFLAKFHITPKEAAKALQISKSKLFEDGYANFEKNTNLLK